MDFKSIKSITIPQGNVKKIEVNGEVLWKSYTNHVPISTDENGNIFNNTGYLEDYRLSSDGTTKYKNNSVVAGFIPAKGGDIIEVAGVYWSYPSSANYINAYTATFSHIGARTSGGTNYSTTIVESVTADGEKAIIKLAAIDSIAYIRVSSCGDDSKQALGSEMIVTVNEEITL